MVPRSTSFSYSHCLVNKKIAPYKSYIHIYGDFGESYISWRVPGLTLVLLEHSGIFVSCLYSLRPEFQPLCGQIIHKDHVPCLDSVISNMVAEEAPLHSLFTLASTLTFKSEIVLAVTPWLLLPEALTATPPPDSIVPSARGLAILTVFAATPDLAITTRKWITLCASVSIFIQSY